jgi:hypothetical protein
MTQSQQDQWERACEIVGVWKRGRYCYGSLSKDLPRCCPRCGGETDWDKPTLQGQAYTTQSHLLPCPSPDDPAALVAMLEWLISAYALKSLDFEITRQDQKYIIGRHHRIPSYADALSLALAAAIKKMPTLDDVCAPCREGRHFLCCDGYEYCGCTICYPNGIHDEE